MRIPGIGKLKNLKDEKIRTRAIKMLKKAGIKKPVYIIKAEYRNFCEKAERSPKDKIGFLSVMNHLTDETGKKWIDKERTRLDVLVELDKDINGHEDK